MACVSEPDSLATATIVVNGYTSEKQDLPQVGLPQGFPLSPILFLFSNAALVQHQLNTKGGSMAFVDDYTAWATRPTAAANRGPIEAIVERALQWERRSGATFEGDKTSLVHFTRDPRRTDMVPLMVKGEHPSYRRTTPRSWESSWTRNYGFESI